MEKITYTYVKEGENILMSKVDPNNLPSNLYQKTLIIIPGRNTEYPVSVYSRTSKKLEPIKYLSRERTAENLEKYTAARKKITEEEASKRVFLQPGDYHREDFLLDYTQDDLKDYLGIYSGTTLFKRDEQITIVSENENIISKISDVSFLKMANNEPSLYKIVLVVDNEVLKIQEFFKGESFYKNKLQMNYSCEEILLNMKTGLTYHFNNQNVESTKTYMQNITTSKFYYSFFNQLPDNVLDDIYEVISSYFLSQYGFKPTCTNINCEKSANKALTLKSFNFNPMCNQLYLLKPFFGSRFRTFFKRNDTSDQFKILCEILEIPNTKKVRKIFLNNPFDVLMVKYFMQAGIKDINNIYKLVDAFVEKRRQGHGFRHFVFDNNEYHGKNTDYSKSPNDVMFDVKKSVFAYITTLLSHTDEVSVVNRLVKDVSDENLLGIVSDGISMFSKLLDLSALEDEVIDKIAAEGMTKYNHDMLSNMLRHIRNPNKKIEYSAKEYEVEEVINTYHFKLAEDTDELLKASAKMGICVGSLYRETALSKQCNIVLVRDDDNNFIACIEIRDNKLIQAKLHHNNRPKEKNPYFNAQCIEWCKNHKIIFNTCADVEEGVSSSSIPEPCEDADPETNYWI